MIDYSLFHGKKIAIIHYWLVGMRGGEKVIEAICEMFPQADIYTHVYAPKEISDTIKSHNIYTTRIQKLPLAQKMYQKYLSFMPAALEDLDLSKYDIVISSESGPAKGVLLPPNVYHISYVHTPMRYLWNMYHEYLGNAGRLTRFAMKRTMMKMRLWDYVTAQRVNTFVANSKNVAQRIAYYYGRDASVVYPPVDINRFRPANHIKEYYLCFGQIVGYKRIDLAIDAFSINKKPLVVAGGGKIKKHVPSNIEIVGQVSDEKATEYLSSCKALIFPGEEDFGIVPVEAQAAGRPVVAFGKGGALETIIDGKTGVFFKEQSVKEINDAIKKFELVQGHFDTAAIRENSSRFSTDKFKEKFAEVINIGYKNFLEKHSNKGWNILHG